MTNEKQVIIEKILDIRDRGGARSKTNTHCNEIFCLLLSEQQTKALNIVLDPRAYERPSSTEIKMYYVYSPEEIKNIFNKLDELQQQHAMFWEAFCPFWLSIIQGLLGVAKDCQNIATTKKFLETTQKIINRLKISPETLKSYTINGMWESHLLLEIREFLSTKDGLFIFLDFFLQLHECPVKDLLRKNLFNEFTKTRTPAEKEKILNDYFISLKKL